MTGSKVPRVIVTDRDRQLLQYLDEAKLLDRDQIRQLLGIRSISQANVRLLQLHTAGLVRRFFLGTIAGGRKAIYSISPKGAATVGLDKVWRFQRSDNELLVGEAFVEHQLAVNWCWISAKYGSDCKLIRFVRFTEPIAPALQLIPDAYAELESSDGVHPFFLEVDLGTESSRVWDRKVELYLKLATSGEYGRIFRQPRFKVAVVCITQGRLESLRRTIRKHTSKLFYFSLLETTNRDGFAHPHWQRPEGDARELIA
jgi:hypothetical protein